MEVPHGMNANESCMIIQKEGHDDDDDMKHLTCANNYSILLLMMCNFVRVRLLLRRVGESGAILIPSYYPFAMK